MIDVFAYKYYDYIVYKYKYIGIYGRVCINDAFCLLRLFRVYTTRIKFYKKRRKKKPSNVFALVRRPRRRRTDDKIPPTRVYYFPAHENP